ncbi:MAG TPA: MFS transporter [Acidimicrobiales bacterium]|nr:MFS transporter [Acidimicrobiales bacterium]
MRDAFGALRFPALRAVWVSLLASAVGDWAARLALAVLVLDRTHSASLSSLVVAVSFVPWIGPGQVLATRLGHLRRTSVMIGADLARAGVFALLLVRLPISATLVLVFVGALATPPFEAARSALTVEAVPGDHYGSAITLLELTEQSAVILGYLLGGATVAAGGYRVALLVDVASFLVSAGALSRIRGLGATRQAQKVTTQLRRAVAVINGDLVMRRGFGAMLVVGLPAAAIEATAAAYSRLALHAGAGRTGLLAAAVPLGIVVTVPFLPRRGSATRLLRAASVVAMIGGFGGAFAFAGGRLAGALIGYFAAGVLSASVTPAQIAFQPRILPDDRPGVFSLLQGMLMSSQAAGAALGGVAIDAAGPRPAAIGWMGLVFVAAGLMLVTLRGGRFPGEERPERPPAANEERPPQGPPATAEGSADG